MVMINCLLIEKNPSERLRLSQIISGLGLTCSESSGAEEAFKYCQDKRPDVVMMDASSASSAKNLIRLFGYQGRRSGRPVVILYSEKSDVHVMADSIMEGAADFLVKPFDGDLLQFKLQQAGVLPH